MPLRPKSIEMPSKVHVRSCSVRSATEAETNFALLSKELKYMASPWETKKCRDNHDGIILQLKEWDGEEKLALLNAIKVFRLEFEFSSSSKSRPASVGAVRFLSTFRCVASLDHLIMTRHICKRNGRQADSIVMLTWDNFYESITLNWLRNNGHL